MMKRASYWMWLMVLLIVAPQAARADETDTYDALLTRDTWISASGGEQLMNGGENTFGRAAKRDENWSFFDWNMADAQSWIDGNVIPPDYYPVFTLSVMPTGGVDATMSVHTLTSENDWEEGDQTDALQWEAMGWTKGQPAATYLYARTYYTDSDDIPASGDEVLDTVNSVPWGSTASPLANFAAINPTYTNSQNMIVTTADGGQYVSVQLDYQLMNDMLNNPTGNNRGLYLDQPAGVPQSNLTIYFDEETNTTRLPPRLTVSFSNEPFPFLWIGNSNAWSTGTAWDPTGPPLTGFDVMFNGYAGTVTLDMDPTVRNWVVRGDQAFIWTGGTVTLNGVMDFAPTAGGANDLYSRITGPGRVEVNSGRLDMLNPLNDYSGGTTIATGARIHVHGSGALGTGSVNASGVLWTNNNNTLAGPLPETGDFAGIIIQENGKLWLNSVETAKVEILPLGALDCTVAGAGSAFNYDYTGSGNIKMSKGAIVTENVPTLPTGGQLADGDGIFGIWLGDSNTDRLVGDGGGTVFRGLASTAGALVYDSTVTETTGGTLGPMFLATAGNTFAFDAATVVADGTNTMKLVGDGTFDIRGVANSFNCDIDTAAGRTLISAADGIAGKTLTATKGFVDMGDPDALRGATTVIEAGGAFQPTFDPALPMGDIGTLTIKTGGALDPHSDQLGSYGWGGGDLDDRLVGKTYTLEKNSQILLRWYSPMATTATGELPGAGLSDYVHYFGRNVQENHIGENRMLLADDTRLTTHWIGQRDSGTWDPVFEAGGTGYIGLAEDQVQARITNQSGILDDGYFRIGAPVNLTGSGTAAGTTGKLIVGDPDPFNCFGRYQHGFTEITQDGKVWLTNAGNIIGSIDIQAGRLRADNVGVLGGATDIHVAAGGEFYAGASMALSATITGSGAVTAAAGQTLTLEPSAGAAGLNPGSSAGIMTINGNVALSSYDPGTGMKYATLDVDVFGAGGVAGTDFDQVDVQGALDVTDGALVVSLPMPGPSLKPADVQAIGDMVIATANVTGTFASAGMGPVGGVSFDTDPQTPGIQLPNHWQPVSGMPLVEIVGGQAILKGANIEWRGLQGDANLDESCDVSDLSLLAGNYRLSGTWFEGDFNFDGNVDVSDLSLLAGSYRLTNPNPPPSAGGQGAPVPEPACIGLLAVGIAGAIRRRRRK